MMTKTLTQPTDLAATLSQAQQEEQAAAALEAKAAEQRARAAEALARAQAEQEAARRRWAEGVLAAYDAKHTEATKTLTAANQAFERSVDQPDTIIGAWMTRQAARTALYGVESERRAAATVLGHAGAHREPRLPRATFPEDVAKLLHDWGMGLLSAEEERVRKAQARVVIGRTTDAK